MDACNVINTGGNKLFPLLYTFLIVLTPDDGGSAEALDEIWPTQKSTTKVFTIDKLFMLFLIFIVSKIIGHNFCARPRYLACCVLNPKTRLNV